MQGLAGRSHRKITRAGRVSTHRPDLARGPRPAPRRATGGPERRRAGIPRPDRRRRTGGATVNGPATRRNPPDANPRPRAWGAALPHDPGLAAILADPGLGATAKLIVIALVKHWAWVKDSCW